MKKDVKFFLKVKQKTTQYRPVCERISDYKEVPLPRDVKHSSEQAARCMDCGTPFCHWACPVGNYIPEWNDLAALGQWEKAFQLLAATNNLPEITGRVCPSLCEYSCVLGIGDDAVTIRENELAVIEYAFANGLIKPQPPKVRTGKKIAVIGSGPAGLSAAVQLNRRGHSVVVFEKDNNIGGITRYGIPDFKLEKNLLDRRISIWKKEGIKFRINTNVGKDYSVSKLLKEFDAVCLAMGSRQPRNLKISGRELNGIYFAMDFLTQSNKRVAGEKIRETEIINVKNKKVVVIGGGDTGSDCVGTALRQGADCVVQIEVVPKPAECRTCDYPWPKYPLILKTSTSHEEGGARQWAVLTKKFIGQDNKLKKIACVKVDFSDKNNKGCLTMKEIPGSEFEIEADAVILAIGFLHPKQEGLVKELGITLDKRGNIKTDSAYMTSLKGVFASGDARRGQSLIVWAIDEGRQAAASIDNFLT
ncbi:MAG: glutamate synthase subunit beta [Candidatus Omnitrophota bacterium]|nr:glutamate synthase subunit beta [Candidatus Omnitrophota bacterium]